MQAKSTKTRKFPKKYASVILRDLEKQAKEKIKDRSFPISTASDSHISNIISEYMGLKLKAKLFPRKYKKVAARKRYEAIKLIISTGSVTSEQLKGIHATTDEILISMVYLKLLQKWAVNEYSKNGLSVKGWRKLGSKGGPVSYFEYESLKIYLEYYNSEIDSIEADSSSAQSDKNHLLDKKIVLQEKIWDVEKTIMEEYWRCVAEKIKPENLCYFFLFDEIWIQNEDLVKAEEFIHDNPDHCIVKKVEEESRVIYRLEKSSKQYLEKLITISCKIINNGIKTAREKEIKASRRKKDSTAAEKRTMIHKLKSGGKSQSQVVKITGWSLSTIKRNWK